MQRYHKEGSEFNRTDYDEQDVSPRLGRSLSPTPRPESGGPLPTPHRDARRKGRVADCDGRRDRRRSQPQSYLGRLLRPHCALMAIPYLSN